MVSRTEERLKQELHNDLLDLEGGTAKLRRCALDKISVTLIHCERVCDWLTKNSQLKEEERATNQSRDASQHRALLGSSKDIDWSILVQRVCAAIIIEFAPSKRKKKTRSAVSQSSEQLGHLVAILESAESRGHWLDCRGVSAVFDLICLSLRSIEEDSWSDGSSFDHLKHLSRLLTKLCLVRGYPPRISPSLLRYSVSLVPFDSLSPLSDVLSYVFDRFGLMLSEDCHSDDHSSLLMKKSGQRSMSDILGALLYGMGVSQEHSDPHLVSRILSHPRLFCHSSFALHCFVDAFSALVLNDGSFRIIIDISQRIIGFVSEMWSNMTGERQWPLIRLLHSVLLLYRRLFAGHSALRRHFLHNGRCMNKLRTIVAKVMDQELFTEATPLCFGWIFPPIISVKSRRHSSGLCTEFGDSHCQSALYFSVIVDLTALVESSDINAKNDRPLVVVSDLKKEQSVISESTHLSTLNSSLNGSRKRKKPMADVQSTEIIHHSEQHSSMLLDIPSVSLSTVPRLKRRRTVIGSMMSLSVRSDTTMISVNGTSSSVKRRRILKKRSSCLLIRTLRTLSKTKANAFSVSRLYQMRFAFAFLSRMIQEIDDKTDHQSELSPMFDAYFKDTWVIDQCMECLTILSNTRAFINLQSRLDWLYQCIYLCCQIRQCILDRHSNNNTKNRTTQVLLTGFLERLSVPSLLFSIKQQGNLQLLRVAFETLFHLAEIVDGESDSTVNITRMGNLMQMIVFPKHDTHSSVCFDNVIRFSKLVAHPMGLFSDGIIPSAKGWSGEERVSLLLFDDSPSMMSAKKENDHHSGANHATSLSPRAESVFPSLFSAFTIATESSKSMVEHESDDDDSITNHDTSPSLTPNSSKRSSCLWKSHRPSDLASTTLSSLCLLSKEYGFTSDDHNVFNQVLIHQCMNTICNRSNHFHFNRIITDNIGDTSLSGGICPLLPDLLADKYGYVRSQFDDEICDPCFTSNLDHLLNYGVEYTVHSNEQRKAKLKSGKDKYQFRSPFVYGNLNFEDSSAAESQITSQLLGWDQQRRRKESMCSVLNRNNQLTQSNSQRFLRFITCKLSVFIVSRISQQFFADHFEDVLTSDEDEDDEDSDADERVIHKDQMRIAQECCDCLGIAVYFGLIIASLMDFTILLYGKAQMNDNDASKGKRIVKSLSDFWVSLRICIKACDLTVTKMRSLNKMVFLDSLRMTHDLNRHSLFPSHIWDDMLSLFHSLHTLMHKTDQLFNGGSDSLIRSKNHTHSAIKSCLTTVADLYQFWTREHISMENDRLRPSINPGPLGSRSSQLNRGGSNKGYHSYSSSTQIPSSSLSAAEFDQVSVEETIDERVGSQGSTLASQRGTRSSTLPNHGDRRSDGTRDSLAMDPKRMRMIISRVQSLIMLGDVIKFGVEKEYCRIHEPSSFVRDTYSMVFSVGSYAVNLGCTQRLCWQVLFLLTLHRPSTTESIVKKASRFVINHWRMNTPVSAEALRCILHLCTQHGSSCLIESDSAKDILGEMLEKVLCNEQNLHIIPKSLISMTLNHTRTLAKVVGSGHIALPTFLFAILKSAPSLAVRKIAVSSINVAMELWPAHKVFGDVLNACMSHFVQMFSEKEENKEGDGSKSSKKKSDPDSMRLIGDDDSNSDSDTNEIKKEENLSELLQSANYSLTHSLFTESCLCMIALNAKGVMIEQMVSFHLCQLCSVYSGTFMNITHIRNQIGCVLSKHLSYVLLRWFSAENTSTSSSGISTWQCNSDYDGSNVSDKWMNIERDSETLLIGGEQSATLRTLHTFPFQLFHPSESSSFDGFIQEHHPLIITAMVVGSVDLDCLSCLMNHPCIPHSSSIVDLISDHLPRILAYIAALLSSGDESDTRHAKMVLRKLQSHKKVNKLINSMMKYQSSEILRHLIEFCVIHHKSDTFIKCALMRSLHTLWESTVGALGHSPSQQHSSQSAESGLTFDKAGYLSLSHITQALIRCQSILSELLCVSDIHEGTSIYHVISLVLCAARMVRLLRECAKERCESSPTLIESDGISHSSDGSKEMMDLDDDSHKHCPSMNRVLVHLFIKFWSDLILRLSQIDTTIIIRNMIQPRLFNCMIQIIMEELSELTNDVINVKKQSTDKTLLIWRFIYSWQLLSVLIARFLSRMPENNIVDESRLSMMINVDGVTSVIRESLKSITNDSSDQCKDAIHLLHPSRILGDLSGYNTNTHVSNLLHYWQSLFQNLADQRLSEQHRLSDLIKEKTRLFVEISRWIIDSHKYCIISYLPLLIDLLRSINDTFDKYNHNKQESLDITNENPISKIPRLLKSEFTVQLLQCAQNLKNEPMLYEETVKCLMRIGLPSTFRKILKQSRLTRQEQMKLPLTQDVTDTEERDLMVIAQVMDVLAHSLDKDAPYEASVVLSFVFHKFSHISREVLNFTKEGSKEIHHRSECFVFYKPLKSTILDLSQQIGSDDSWISNSTIWLRGLEMKNSNMDNDEREWVSHLVSSLCRCTFKGSILQHCSALCLSEPTFAAFLFPFVISEILFRETFDKNCRHQDYDECRWTQTAFHLSVCFNALIERLLAMMDDDDGGGGDNGPSRLVRGVWKCLEMVLFHLRREHYACVSQQRWKIASSSKKDGDGSKKKKKKHLENDIEDDSDDEKSENEDNTEQISGSERRKRKRLASELQESGVDTRYTKQLRLSVPTDVLFANLNQLNVASLFLKIGENPFECVYWCETWAQCRFGLDIPMYEVLDLKDTLNESDSQSMKKCRSLLAKAFTLTGDKDAVYGVLRGGGGEIKTDLSTALLLARHESEHLTALRTLDAHHRYTDTMRDRILLDAGCLGLVGHFNGHLTHDKQPSLASFEADWRRFDWSAFDESVKKKSSSHRVCSFAEAIGDCLRLSAKNEPYLLDVKLESAGMMIVDDSMHINDRRSITMTSTLPQMAEDLNVLIRAQMLADLRSELLPNSLIPDRNRKPYHRCLGLSSEVPSHLHYSLKQLEPLVHLQCLLRSRSGAVPWIRHFSEAAEWATGVGDPTTAHVFLLKSMSKVSSQYSSLIGDKDGYLTVLQSKFTEGVIEAECGRFDSAISCFSSVVSAATKLPSQIHKDKDNQRLRVRALVECARLSSENQRAGFEECSSMLKLAESKSEHYGMLKERFECASEFARLCFDCYSALKLRMESETWEKDSLRIEKETEEVQVLNQTISELESRIKAHKNAAGDSNATSRSRRVHSKHSKMIMSKEELVSVKQRLMDAKVLANRMEKQLKRDTENRQSITLNRKRHLRSAVDQYCRCLSLKPSEEGESHSKKPSMLALCRLISLWFSNSDNPMVTMMVARAALDPSEWPSASDHSDAYCAQGLSPDVCHVPSKVFLPLIAQICSRLSSDHSPSLFSLTLFRLVRKLALDHPFHALSQLFLLRNADQLDGSARVQSGFETDQSRKKAANELLDWLKKQPMPMSRRVIHLGQLIDAYRELCEKSAALVRRDASLKKFEMSREGCILSKVSHSQYLPVLTASLPVRSQVTDYGYESYERYAPFVSSFVNRVSLASTGITRPVIVECVDQNGVRHKQLVKAQDDLRQDSVMEQLMGLVDGIRTYKVVPLTASLGLVEWVSDTSPLGSVLNQMHSLMKRPGDLSVYDSRLEVMESQNTGDAATIAKCYRQVCERFPPVMHHYFRHCWCFADDWFDSVLRYTRSVAATSIAGFLLGLGDRHTQNILVDSRTGEVIHIDLGVAFDAGLLLKTPERVPFRLTRDMVDALGVRGTHGSFRRHCCAVLTHLRTQQAVFDTMLSVFVFDPLYRWSLSPAKVARIQGGSLMPRVKQASSKNESGNAQALSALKRVKEKFQGLKQGQRLSVEGHVNHLLRQATDERNLCQMFHGWCAWM